jgi:hypothetical protein
MLEVGHTRRGIPRSASSATTASSSIAPPHGRYDPPRGARSRRARPPVRSTRAPGPSALGPRRGLSIHVARLSRQCITSVMFAVRIDEARRIVRRPSFLIPTVHFTSTPVISERGIFRPQREPTKKPEIVMHMGRAARTLNLALRAVSAICNLDDGGLAAALLTSPLLPRGVNATATPPIPVISGFASLAASARL